MMEHIQKQLELQRFTLDASIEHLQSYIYTMGILVTEALNQDKALLVFTQNEEQFLLQYLKQRLLGNYKFQRKPIRFFALENDIIINKEEKDYLFSRQLEVLANQGDVCIGISLDGRDKAVNLGLKYAKLSGMKAIGMSGCDGGIMQEVSDVNVVIPSGDNERICEMHLMILNQLCSLIDMSLTQE